jgi:hypothetical protein
MNGFNLKSMLPVMAVMLLIGLITSGKLEPFYFWFFLLAGAALIFWTAKEADLLPRKMVQMADVSAHNKKIEAEAEKVVESNRDRAFKERLNRMEQVDMVEMLSRGVFGQDAALEKISRRIMGYLAAKRPAEPLTIALMSPAGYGKERLARNISKLMGFLNEGGSQFDIITAHEGSKGYGDAVASAKGVFALKQASKGKIGELGHVLKGERKREDLHLIVVLIENVETRDINDIHRRGDDDPQPLMDALAAKTFGEIRDCLDMSVVFQPLSNADMARTLWQAAAEAAENQYGIKINSWTEENSPELTRWILPYVRQIIDDDIKPAAIQALIVEAMMPALVRAQRCDYREVDPQVNEDFEIELIGYETQSNEHQIQPSMRPRKLQEA